MKPHRKKKLITILGSLALLSGAVALLLFAIGDYANAFYSPTEIVAGKAKVGKTIRVGGLVPAGSVQRSGDSLYVEFDITDNQETITIIFDKSLPDLFREGQGIMAEGKLIDNKTVKASKVLAKHDEKYMPPEIADALKKSHEEGVKKMAKPDSENNYNQ